MTTQEIQEKCFSDLVKSRMDEIGLQYTDEQATLMSDFVMGIALLSQEIEKDSIIRKIRR